MIKFLLGLENEQARLYLALVYTAFAWFPLSYLLLFQLDERTIRELGVEDGVIETIGAIFFLIGSLVLLWAYIISRSVEHNFFAWRTQGKLYLLLLGILLFICFAEEISWGQRIFRWESSGWWLENNAQKETNFHNLWIFQAYNPDGSQKSFFALLFNSNRLLSIFWLAYCVLLPIANQYFGRVRALISYAGVPVPPLLVGGLFVVNYVAFRSIVALGGLENKTLSAFNELKESNYSAAFTVLAVYFALGVAGHMASPRYRSQR